MNVLKGQFFKISAFQKSYTRIITSRVFFTMALIKFHFSLKKIHHVFTYGPFYVIKFRCLVFTLWA